MSKNECLQQLTLFSSRELSQSQKPKSSPFRFKKEHVIGAHSHTSPSLESTSLTPQEDLDILALENTEVEDTPEERRNQNKLTLGFLGALGAAGFLALIYCLWQESEINKYKQAQYSHDPNASFPTVIISRPPTAEASYLPTPSLETSPQITMSPGSSFTATPTPTIEATPSPTKEATPTLSPFPTETPLEFTVDQPFMGEAGQIYEMDAWYLVNGDVKIRSSQNPEFVPLYDNLEETAEQVIVGPGSQVLGDYGFSATSLYGETQFTLDDKNQEIINKSMDSKFNEVLYGPNGQYQFETIKLDLLSGDGSIKNIGVFTRENN